MPRAAVRHLYRGLSSLLALMLLAACNGLPVPDLISTPTSEDAATPRGAPASPSPTARVESALVAVDLEAAATTTGLTLVAVPAPMPTPTAALPPRAPLASATPLARTTTLTASRLALTGRTLAGTGPQTTRPFWLDQGLVIFHARHEGRGSFSVDLLDEEGKTVGRIASASGPESNKALQVRWPGNYLLNVRAGGSWSVTVEPGGGSTVPAPLAPQSLTGTGTMMTGQFEMEAGEYIIRVTQQEAGTVKVGLVQQDGRTAGSISTGRGNSRATRVIRLTRAGLYFFDVTATGDWAITIEPESASVNGDGSRRPQS